MLLLVAATEMEMAPLRARLGAELGWATLVAGVGPVATTLALCRYLASEAGRQVAGLLNFGVAGAFPASGLGLLDLCLAHSEVLGDFGICQGEETVPFAFPLPEPLLPLDADYLQRARRALLAADLAVATGNFVTVNSVSSSGRRGELLRDRFRAVCENMEGAAVAMVGRAYALPVLELRCVSNMVEDRRPEGWRLEEAACRCAAAMAALLPAFRRRP